MTENRLGTLLLVFTPEIKYLPNNDKVILQTSKTKAISRISM